MSPFPASAVEKFRLCDYDLIFLDVKLPGKSGVERFREMARCGRRGVVLVTGFDVQPLTDEAVAQAPTPCCRSRWTCSPSGKCWAKSTPPASRAGKSHPRLSTLSIIVLLPRLSANAADCPSKLR